MKKQDIPAAVVKAFNEYNRAIDDHGFHATVANKLHMINTGETYQKACTKLGLDIVKCTNILMNHKV